MRSRRSQGAGLISLVIIYIILVALILIFANQILFDISLETPFSNFVIVPFAIALPLFLLGAIIFNIIRIIREKKTSQPGIRFKIRLILFFSFLSLLSSIPQGIISISFIDTAMNSWFSSRLKEGLEGGMQIAVWYHRDKLHMLESAGESSVFPQVAREALRDPERAWDILSRTYPDIGAAQGFDREGREVFSLGREELFYPQGRGEPLAEGLLPKEHTAAGSVLRLVKNYTEGNIQYYVVLSTQLPADFDSDLEDLSESLEVFTQIERFQTLFRIALLIFYSFFSVPIILLSILVSFFITEEIIRPIVNLEEATRHVAEGDFSIRILARTGDELSMLIESFNSMISELERTRVRMIQTEKVTAWQEIAQRMAHEIKNPLTPIKLSAQRIIYKYENNREELDKILIPAATAIIKEVENLDRLLKEFSEFARLPSPHKGRVQVLEILKDTEQLYSKPFPEVLFNYSLVSEDHWVLADKNMLRQVFANVVKNSVEAMEGKGEVFIRSDLVRKGNSLYCRIQIQDTGCGIRGEFTDQVFNPYFSTKKNGTGLGLPIVERIVFDHKGQIWFESMAGKGTTFFIDLPAELINE